MVEHDGVGAGDQAGPVMEATRVENSNMLNLHTLPEQGGPVFGGASIVTSTEITR